MRSYPTVDAIHAKHLQGLPLTAWETSVHRLNYREDGTRYSTDPNERAQQYQEDTRAISTPAMDTSAIHVHAKIARAAIQIARTPSRHATRAEQTAYHAARACATSDRRIRAWPRSASSARD